LKIQPSAALFELTVYVVGKQVFLRNQVAEKSRMDVGFLGQNVQKGKEEYF